MDPSRRGIDAKSQVLALGLAVVAVNNHCDPDDVFWILVGKFGRLGGFDPCEIPAGTLLRSARPLDRTEPNVQRRRAAAPPGRRAGGSAG